MECKSILVPVDGSQGARQAEAIAVELARATGASLVFLHVVDIEKAMEHPGAAACAGQSSVLEDVVHQGRQLLSQVLEQSPDDIQATGHCIHGQPRKVILEQADAVRADIIVMGSHGLSAIQSVLLGSVSRYVLEHAGCPVVLVKADGGQVSKV